MKHLFLALAFCCALIGPSAKADPDAIRSVIQNQLDAFQADDLATAYGFASPGIQRMFPDPDVFGRMVKQGYPMVWRPSGVRFGGLADSAGRQIQSVFLTDQAGRTYVAEYDMIETEEGWRIAGVRIREVDLGA